MTIEVVAKIMPIVNGRKVTNIGNELARKGTKKDPWMSPRTTEAIIPTLTFPSLFSPFDERMTASAALIKRLMAKSVCVSF